MVAKGLSIFFGLILFYFIVSNPEQVVQIIQLILNAAYKIAHSLGGLDLHTQK